MVHLLFSKLAPDHENILLNLQDQSLNRSEHGLGCETDESGFDLGACSATLSTA